jgi:TonB family protein
MPEESRSSVQISQLEAALGGKYKIHGRIGAGGFGEVYLGEHTQLHRKVAIKILLHSISSQEDLVKRFQREARSAAALSHPNIIDIYDVGEGEGIYFFVMKYIEGETLSQKMQRERTLGPAYAIHIVQQIADALDYAHQNNVVHRDIKPANVMLDGYGKPLLMDFGVARVQYEGNLTKTGTLLGTPHYLAPEQPLGKAIDGRSDIYSLGIMFYEMLSGRPPFHDENSITLIFKHINEPPQPLTVQAPDLDPELCFVVHKMIEKSPENRFQTAGEVVDALQKLRDIYPVPITTGARRTAPGDVLSTEKLLILAQDHIDQNKLSKAIEILGTISKKDPGNETVKRQIQDLLPKLTDQIKTRIAAKDFRQARQLISQISQLSPQSTEIIRLRQQVITQETQIRDNNETLLKEHYVAAQQALENNRPSQAIEHLTHACTIDSSSQEVQLLLRQTEGKITSEIKMLCERLDFTGAEKMLELGKQAFPTMVQTKAPTIERHRELYQVLQQGKEQFQQERWEDAERSFMKFLDARGPYEFAIFETLRKEAEDFLTKTREKIQEVQKPTPATIARETPVPVVPTPSAPVSKGSLVRIGIYIVLGALIAGAAWWITNFLKQQATPEPQANIPIARKAIDKPVAKPTTGELSITSEPPGAAVFVGTEQKGVTPLKLSQLPFGKHAITLKLKGYQDVTQEVELSENQAVLNLPAVMQQAVPQIGILVIESVPDGADIAMGTRMVGQTPKTMDKISIGKYTIRLRKEGYEDYTETVRIKDGQTTNVKAQLVEIPKPVAEPVKPKEPEIKPGTLVTLGPGVTPPKTISKTPVDYPEAARKQKLAGTVQLNLLISETGQVMDVKVLKSAHPILDEAAVRTVKQWIYEPAKKQNVPVRVWLSSSITFVKR